MSLNSGNTQLRTKIQNFSVETVNNILQLNNKELAKLCAQASLMPKKTPQGKIYFSKEDIEILRKIKHNNKKSTQNEVAISKTVAKSPYVSVPMKDVEVPVQIQKQSKMAKILKQLPEQKNLPQKAPEQSSQASAALVEKICTSLSTMENSMLEQMSKLLDERLSEKLDGMDEVVVELVRCKTENETLRYKMNELNKELYNAKNELSKYQSIGLGLYIKKNGDSSLI